ncbi:CPBP family intramembrane glutamic endopeptidase [Mucilaginibacter sp. SJ]|uniref:CPBP family intramembrane glutamic endopeptidase n=1 Tax=Mucilaginibacter sp. SJ TaxID=3029053 RepID=UPI0023A9B83B|nr:CPBP family intramembrane glutamic endopeptidase [Mucilaginibacter sp. SJ]WEA00640.1 CPBP family intramembrane metalloprotease [Mucilaginibacter sp. SJ]
MKKWFRTYPDMSRLILSAFLLATALIGSGFIHISFVPVGMVLVILVTWVMLRSEGRDLSFLGFDVKVHHLLLIPAGLVLGITSFLLSFYVGTLVRGDHIMFNRTIDGTLLLKEFWQVLPTAAVQDFIIVGYCYVKLIELSNKWIATVMFGIFFICLHNIWGSNIVNDLFYASGLFIGYLMFSTAFLRSGSIWLVIGLHWGNNFANSYLFTFTRTATSWLFISGQQKHDLTVWQAIGLFIALNIGTVSVIAATKLIWRTKK